MVSRIVIFALLATAALAQIQTTCPDKCADCQTDLGVTTCNSCFNTTFAADFSACNADPLQNCLIANRAMQCVQCLPMFALNSTNGTCVPGKVKNCLLEYVDDAANKCVVCNGSFPTDDLTACSTDVFPPTSDCLWGTVLGNCIKCRYDNLMAANSGQCVGRYLYGCLQENGIGRCNGCDHTNGFYMKFGSMCWKD